MYRVGREKLDPGTGLQMWNVDVDYLKVMGIKLAEGRNFSPRLASDSQAAIINQTMARKMGLTHPSWRRNRVGDPLAAAADDPA